MIQAGEAVDKSIAQLAPLLDDGDIIIDGGNSNFNDSIRRTAEVEALGKLYIGAGISGGEEGARYGPSIMPGGSPAAWESVKPILQAVAAKVPDGTPCCDWVGEDGAGHFVKMVHNGIEYGDMQLICEAYHLMTAVLGMSEAEIGDVFRGWNKGILESFLIEITGNILAYLDEDGRPLLRKILDTASQKGTGKWTAVTALQEGTPLTLIGEAVFARFLSAIKEQRVAASKVLTGPSATFDGDKAQFIRDLEGGSLRGEDHQLYPGLYADARCGAHVQLESQLRRCCLDVARGLHHSFGIPEQDSRRLCAEPGAGESLIGRLFPGRGHPCAVRLAADCDDRHRTRHSPADHERRASILRWLSLGQSAGEPAAGATRLLRRAYLRARGSSARRIFSYQLDRYRRRCDGWEL